MAKSGSGSSSRGSRSYYSRSRQSRPSSVASRPASVISHPKAPTSHWQIGSGSGSGQRRVSIRSRHSSIRPPSLTCSSQTPQPRPLQPPPQVPTSTSQNDDSREDADHVIMALDVKEKGNIGCAYYVSKEERLLCMEDIPRGEVDIMDRRKHPQRMPDEADHR